MVQPVRPQDVSSLYRQQSISTSRSGNGTQAGNEPNRTADAVRGRRTDRVMLSDEAQQLQRVLNSMTDLPEVREQRITALRQQIDTGTYDRGITQIAQRMVEDGIIS